MNSLHNLMGHRVAPGGTSEDLERFVQSSFDYCWRYYPWTFSLKKATILDDGILPTDMDIEGYRKFDGITEVSLEDTLTGTTGSAITWDGTQLILDPISAGTIVYQITPPTLTVDVNVPFPSSQVVAVGATVYAKQAENPTRADVQQEWDMFHSELDRLVGWAGNNRQGTRTPRNRHSVTGTHTGQTG